MQLYCREEAQQLIKKAVEGEGTEYLLVMGPSSVDRIQEEKLWQGAEYQLSFAFVLQETLKQEQGASGKWQEEGNRKEKGKRRHRQP